MKLDPILGKATRIARGGNYEESVKILESEESMYRGSFHYSYLLGVCYLHLGDYSGALENFRHAARLKTQNPLPLLGMAVYYLRRGDIEKTVDCYLDVQELDKNNRIAKKALNIIRKHARGDDFSSVHDTGILQKLYPPVPFAGLSAGHLAVSAALLLSLFIMCFGILVNTNVIQNPLKKKGDRNTITGYLLDADDRNQPVQTSGSYRYVLTRTEVLSMYERAQSLFTTYRDEKAKIELNRILESNASENIKNKARILISFMEIPGFDNFNKNDNVPYSDAIQDPPLYREVHVIWRGMAANVNTIQNVTTFDLLVGYDTYRTMEGQVRVVFPSAVAVNTERPLEVLGRIVPTGGQGYGIMLEGVAIHQSGRLANQ
jgi:tetratricopeptide (TPR) repeat protein